MTDHRAMDDTPGWTFLVNLCRQFGMSYLSDIYQKMAVDLNPTEDYFTSDSRFLALDEIVGSLPPGNLCDLGCGRGTLIRRFRNQHEVYGTEFDPSLVRDCQAAGLRVESIDLNEANALPFPGVVFDTIVVSEVCEHLLDPRHTLALAQQSLRAGGKLIVSVPNAVPLMSRLRLLCGRTVNWLHYPSCDTETTGHIRFYTIESMSRLLREVGFTVETVQGVSFRMNGRFWGRLCYWLAKLSPRESAATQIDACLGKFLPGFSPGLLFICRNP